MVLISARPFRIGDRVRLQGGGLAGQIEGTVASLGLLYVTFAQGEDSIMVPNNVVLSSAVVPLREPAAVDLRARLRPDVKPSEVQRLLHEGVRIPVRAEPHISLEEIDSDEVVVRIAATPESEEDGPRLADEVLSAIASITREGDTDERMAARTARSDDTPARMEDRKRERRRLRAHGRALALVLLALGHRLGDVERAEPALHAAAQLGQRGPRRRCRPAARSGATSISERLRSIALMTAAATSSGVFIAT